MARQLWWVKFHGGPMDGDVDVSILDDHLVPSADCDVDVGGGVVMRYVRRKIDFDTQTVHYEVSG